MRQVLFIQGGGADTHDEWDHHLVVDLQRALGVGWDVRYPRMPDEGHPSHARWGPTILREVADLEDGAVVVGHSVGGTLLVHALADRPPQRRLGAVLLLSAPWVGDGGWPGPEFELPADLGARLPPEAVLHVFHGGDDATVPSAHAQRYAQAVGQAQLHLLPGRDHQLNGNMGEVADVCAELLRVSSWPGRDLR